jgi:ABC-type multidrug transport system permease subunit
MSRTAPAACAALFTGHASGVMRQFELGPFNLKNLYMYNFYAYFAQLIVIIGIKNA